MRLFVGLCQVSRALGAPVSKFSSARRLIESLEKYAAYHPTTLSLESMYEFGTGKNACATKSFLFLRKELPVRLANIMKEINLLPDQLLGMPSVKLVEGWYEQSFQEILKFESADPSDKEMLDSFNETLDMIRNRHVSVVETMAKGVIEMKEHCPAVGESKESSQVTQYFLDRFYMSRISIRMLIHQHLLLFAQELENHPRHVGSIDPSCNVLNVAKDAYENARFLCEQYYMTAPDCQFKVINPLEEPGSLNPTIAMTYVPSHLYHMLFELIKNSLRAVVEYHNEGANLPALEILMVKGSEDLAIKISDQGGGISRTEMDLLFQYMYSTAPRPPSPQESSTTPLAGYGYGLPLSRLYAKYFNGDLQLNSVEGYGTDAYIFLKILPSDASELLPVFNKTSYNKYAASVPVGDWSDPSQTGGLHGAVHQFTSGGSRNYSTHSRHTKKH